MKLRELFSTQELDGTHYALVAVDLQTYKCYPAISGMIHGYGGAYSQKILISGEVLAIEELRQYAKNALERKADMPYRIEPFLNITKEELIDMLKEYK